MVNTLYSALYPWQGTVSNAGVRRGTSGLISLAIDLSTYTLSRLHSCDRYFVSIGNALANSLQCLQCIFDCFMWCVLVFAYSYTYQCFLVFVVVCASLPCQPCAPLLPSVCLHSPPWDVPAQHLQCPSCCCLYFFVYLFWTVKLKSLKKSNCVHLCL